jgi:hypothetical protein
VKQRAAATTRADWSDWENWLRMRLVEERAFVLECVGTALGQALKKEREEQRRELASEVRSLRIELAEVGETINELRRVITASNRCSGAGGEVIDLPASRRN